MSKREKRRILLLLSGLVLLMISLVVYLTYFQFFKGEFYANHPGNRRNIIERENINRGSILDRDGKILAETQIVDEKKERIYHHPRIYSHIIGYSSAKLGKSGLEASMNQYLTDDYQVTILENIKRNLDQNRVGADLYLTIDTGAQNMASELLGDNIGSIVALDPKTGDILAMSSKPDFDSSTLEADWEELNKRTDSPLYNRALNGQYPPGSVMKVISAGAIIENEIERSYEHTGTQTIDGYQYRDATSKVYGTVNLDTAMAQSLNTYFVQKIQDVGLKSFETICNNFGFEEKLDLPLSVSVSSLNLGDDPDKNLLSASSIGQGRVLATPLEMAMVASGVANDGIIMKPRLVSTIVDPNNENQVVKEYDRTVFSKALEESTAQELKDLMVGVTRYGTGQRAAIQGVQVAGKTGTAENATGTSHAWYIGFAPADDPKVAVAVIIEGGTSGGTVAAPIAREMINYVLNNVD